MRRREDKFSLSSDRATALELLRLQEAAQLANNRFTAEPTFRRNENLSLVVLAVFNVSQLIVAAVDEIFHHVHHFLNRRIRLSNPDVPEMPEERNPVFYVYPICMGISLILFILCLTTRLFYRAPIIALIGNTLGAVLILVGGISAMRHAQKHIDLNKVSDEELLLHPVFVHNFVICILSVFGAILYLVPTWILVDMYKWRRKEKTAGLNTNTRNSKKRNVKSSKNKNKKQKDEVKNEDEYYCTCRHGKNRAGAHHGWRMRANNAELQDTDQNLKNNSSSASRRTDNEAEIIR